MKVRLGKVLGLVALGTVVGFVDGCGPGATEVGSMSAQLVSSVWDAVDQAPERGESERPSVDFQGTYISFDSCSSGIVEDDDNGYRDVFRFDTRIRHNALVSTSSEGEPTNYGSRSSSMSADGKLVVFQSRADNLLASSFERASEPGPTSEDVNDDYDIYLKHMDTGEVECITWPSATDYDGRSSEQPTISADGRYVCFESYHDFSGDYEWGSDYAEVWVFDRLEGTYQLVSRDPDGDPIGHEYSYCCRNSRISGDGQYVVFETKAALGDLGDDNESKDVYRVRLSTGAIELVTVNVEGNAAGADACTNCNMANASISFDGRYVAFESDATDLTGDDVESSGVHQVFVRDMNEGVTVCLSKGLDGTVGDYCSKRPSLSADGRYCAFDSRADNLVEGDLNEKRDVFVCDLSTGALRRLGNPMVVVPGYEESEEGQFYTCQLDPAISGNGRVVAYVRGTGPSVIMAVPNPFLGGSTDESQPLPYPFCPSSYSGE